jgi:DNA-binding NarL/FixJ family response regulator
MTILLSDPRILPTSGPLLEVDLAAVAANTTTLAARATGEVMAVVKADGFGHDAIAVAGTALAHGATWLGVTSSYVALTDKERVVFGALAQGLSNAEIGAQIFASESTVKTHVGAILRKLGLRDRVQIVVFAHEHGLVAD